MPHDFTSDRPSIIFCMTLKDLRDGTHFARLNDDVRNAAKRFLDRQGDNLGHRNLWIGLICQMIAEFKL